MATIPHPDEMNKLISDLIPDVSSLNKDEWIGRKLYDFLMAVSVERGRQETLKAQGKFKWSCADTSPDIMYHVSHTNIDRISERTFADAGRLAVLAEEFGEVSRHIVEALIDSSRYNVHELRKELIQVAAVCAAWFESTED